MSREGQGPRGQASSVAAGTMEPAATAVRAGAGSGEADSGHSDGGQADRGQAGHAEQEASQQHDAAAARGDGTTAAAGRAMGLRLRAAAGSRAARHLALIAAYTAAGIAVTWPRAAYLTSGLLPRSRDVSSYVWALYWIAHQVAHLGNPWFTNLMAAPVGVQLGFDTLMPLPGLLMTPVTLAFGPSASFSLLTIAMPGLLCYVMYRAARLWLTPAGAIAAGAFFGLATMVAWQNWYHLNIAMGTLFLPMTLEAAIRLGRGATARRGVILGAVLGASVLTNQESAVLAVLLAAVMLIPWLVMTAIRDRPAARAAVRALTLGGCVAAVIAAPQLIAMLAQASAGGAKASAGQLIRTYADYGVGLPTLFAPSPRLAHFGLGHLAASYGYSYSYSQPTEGVPTFGFVLTALAVAGLLLSWRRASSWWLALLWLTGAALALGPVLMVSGRRIFPGEAIWHHVHVSELLPYTWLVRLPGLSALREADRLALLGLLGAAVLAGAAVDWLSRRRLTWPLILVILAAGALEAGWSPRPVPHITMPTTMAALDRPIAADHSGSVVLDLPFGLRGGIPLYGHGITAPPLLVATDDGHPRSISYTSWVPRPTISGIERHAFYRDLGAAQNGRKFRPPQIAAARADLRRLRIGWVLIWYQQRPSVMKFLAGTGIRFRYRADGVSVYRPTVR